MWYALDMSCNHNNMDLFQNRIANRMIAPTTDLIDIFSKCKSKKECQAVRNRNKVKAFNERNKKEQL